MKALVIVFLCVCERLCQLLSTDLCVYFVCQCGSKKISISKAHISLFFPICNKNNTLFLLVQQIGALFSKNKLTDICLVKMLSGEVV